MDLVHIDHVVVHRVEMAGVRRRDPGGVSAALGVVDLVLHHIHHGPVPDLHALADLTLSVDPGPEAHIHVVQLVAGIEDRLGQVVPQVHRPGLGLDPDLGASAVQEPGIGEEYPALGRP